MECLGFLFVVAIFWLYASSQVAAKPPAPQVRDSAAEGPPDRKSAPKKADPAPRLPKANGESVPLKRCAHGGCTAKIGLKRKFCRKHAKEAGAFAQRHCGNKIQHATDACAREHARELAQKSRDAYSVYFCELCNFYHVGHSKEGRRRGGRR